MKIDPLICFWLKNAITYNRTKSSVYENHVNDKTQTQKP